MPEKQSARCHCGSVVFQVQLVAGFDTLRRCNCSFCRMRGAVIALSLPPEVVQGLDKLTEYRFNSRTVPHYFCSVCGIYTFHQSRSTPERFAINVACLDGVSPFDFSQIDVTDGENHPNDGGAGGIAGVLSFTPAK